MMRNSWPIWIKLFYVFLCNIIKINLLFVSILLHLISSFLLTRSLLDPHEYVSMESIDCILLSSFELKQILLTASVKTLSLSLSNICCVFNIDLSFFMNSLYFFMTIYVNLIFFQIIYFILKLSCFSTVFIIFKFKFSFHDTLFVPIVFLSFLPPCIK